MPARFARTFHPTPTGANLLHKLEKIGSPALESELIEKSTETRVRTEFDIGELERRKLLRRDYDQDRRGYTLTFTLDGLRALLEIEKAEAGKC
ncbi:MAG: hypothetical protein ACK5OI_04640 [Curvibacter sp.]